MNLIPTKISALAKKENSLQRNKSEVEQSRTLHSHAHTYIITPHHQPLSTHHNQSNTMASSQSYADFERVRLDICIIFTMIELLEPDALIFAGLQRPPLESASISSTT